MDNVNVAIRVRPLIQREKNVEAEPQWKAETNKISQLDSRGRVSRIYAFDRVFNSSETTNDVYEEIALPILEKAMDGVNGTIFAYGQTASGKTYTMMGDRMCPGIIPRAVQDIFTQIDNTSNREFLLRVSYMELYNEGLSDLLSSEKKTLQIRENDKTVFVHDLTEEVVTNVSEVLQFLKKGEARRHFGQTDMNERSSRSHTIFRMIIESRETSPSRKSVDTAVKVSHLNLVDLAGSERANETKADGIRLREACKINQSLHVLAMVINKLSQGAEFIPFRDSKLTRILQMSLGGNAKTAIICTVTPISVEQTHSTLQFASRAKTIKNKPEVNEVVSDEAMMQRQKKEIQELKRKISELEQQGELFEEKTRLHETQEQKIKILQKMILVSGGAGISDMPTNETTKAKYKRRQTWCPGMANPLPLLRPNKPPSELASNIPEETLPLSSPENNTTQSSQSPDEEMRQSDADASPQESVSSVESEEFSNTKQFQFWEDMEMEKETEDDFVAVPLNTQRKKRKRREAHVHFAHFGVATVDADSQTEINSPNAADTQQSEALIEANNELQEQILALEDTVSTLRENIAVLSEEMDSRELAKQQLADLTSVNQGLESKNLVLESNNQALESNNQALESNNQGLESKNQALESKIQELEEGNLMVSQLSDALCLSEEKVAASESRNQDADQQISTLTEDVRLLKAQLEDANRLKAQLEDANRLQELAEKKQQETMKEQLDQQETLEAALSHSEQEVVSLRATLEETKFLLASAENKEEEAMEVKTQLQLDQQDSLKDSLQLSELEISSLKAQLEEYEVQLASSLESEQKASDLTTQHDQLKDLFEKAKLEISSLKAQLEEYEVQLAPSLENEQKISDLTEQRDQLRIIFEKSEQENASLKAQLEENEVQLAPSLENEQQVSDLTTKHNQLRNLFEKSELEISSLKAQLEEYEVQLAPSMENKQKISDLTEQNNQLRNLFEKSEQENSLLKAHLEENEVQLAPSLENKQQISDLTAEHDHFRSMFEKSELEVSSLKAQLKENGVRLASSLENEQKVSDLTAQHDELRNLFEKSEQEVSSLKAQLEENEVRFLASSVENEQKVLDLTAQQDQLTSLFEKSEQEISSLKSQLEENEVRLASSLENEQKVSDLTAQHVQLKNLFEKSKQEILSLKAQLEDDEVRSVSSLENEQKVLDLTAQHDQLRNSLEKAEQEILALKGELQERDTHIASLLENKEEVFESQCEQLEDMKDLLLSKEQELLALKVEMKDRQILLASTEENALQITQVKELTKILGAQQEEINTLNLCLVEQGKEAEETRNHHIARIAELTGLLEDQEGQAALAAGPSMDRVESDDGAMSLADELEEQNWKVKARRTKSDLLGSVQLCEDIMEEKTKLSRQMSQFQDEMTNLKQALKAKEEEFKELQEFTEMEMTVMREQETQYQRDIDELRLELQEKQSTLAVQHHREIEDLQKKLSVKDKVLEAQYQQDVDELLDKLRQKNQNLDNLQEQQSELVRAAGLAEQKVEQLQDQLRDLEGCGVVKESGSMEGQDQAAVQPGIDQQVQTEEYNKESPIHTAVSVLEEATQVSPEELGLLADGSSAQAEILQQRIDELEVIEASLRQDCETLNATVSSQDQEIAVLDELLEDLGKETKDNTENSAKIAAFVERIEQLENQLQERELPTTKGMPDVDQEIQVLTEVNDNLSQALTEAESTCENFRAKVVGLEEALRHEVTSKRDLDSSKEKDLLNLREELDALKEVNVCLSEKLTRTQELCEKLEGKLLQSSSDEKQRESEDEICTLTAVIEQQGQEMASQRVKLEEKEENLRSNVRDLEDRVSSLTRENQSLVERIVSEASKHDQSGEDIKIKDILLAEQLNKLTTLSERLSMIEEELHSRTVQVQELEAALASQSSQSAEAAEIIRRRDGELEMLREVLQEQEENLESARNEFSQEQFRVRDLEREVKFLNDTKGDQMVHEGQKESEIHRLHGLLQNQEEHLRTKERHLMECLSKIQNLESVLAANNHMNLEKSKAEAEQNAKVHKLQNYLEELENQLRAREIKCSELESKLQDLERVVAANDQKRVDQEDVKQKLDAEVTTLQGYLDEADEELHQFKNRYADLQADFRKQQTNLKNMKAVLESRSKSTKMLEAAVAKHDEEKGVLRALLDERNHTALRQEDRYSDMLAKIQNLEGIIASKEQTTKESEDLLKIQAAELSRLQAAHTSYQEQQDRRLQEEITRREGEILSLRQQLEKVTTDSVKLDVDELVKTHRQELAEKNLCINRLETDLLRGTDPLERKLVSLKEELKYQESKMQQYKKEVEKLRSQQSQRASSSTPGSDSIEERRPEATGGSGIIESCAIFAVKAENYKLTKSLEKTKKELEYKDLKYHDEVTKKTHAEQDARYWKEKARSLASHLKRAPQRSESVTSSPLKERNTNDVTVAKKSRLDDSTGTKYVEKIGGLKNSSSSESSTTSSSTSKSKRADYNWLNKAIAERDAEEKPDDDPQQCATQ